MKYLFILSLLFLVGCDGGGDETVNTPPTNKLAPFEFQEGMCSFDSTRAIEIARNQFPVEIKRCSLFWVNNKYNNQFWPSKSWPSSKDVNE